MLEHILDKKLDTINNESINAPDQIRTLRGFVRELNEDVEFFEARCANLLLSYNKALKENAELKEELDGITLEHQEERAYNKEVLERLVANNEDLQEQIAVLKETNEKLTLKLLEKGL